MHLAMSSICMILPHQVNAIKHVTQLYTIFFRLLPKSFLSAVSSSQQTMRDSIKQLLTESSVDLHIAMSTDPSSIAVLLYSSLFIGDSTLNYVRTAVGVSNHDKAFRVLDDCRSNILSHPNPKDRLMKFIVILKDSQPTTRLVAMRIEEKVGRTISLHLDV